MLIQSAAKGLYTEENKDDQGYAISASELKSNYVSIFGPDIEYFDGTISEFSCMGLGLYSASEEKYYAFTQCGGIGAEMSYEVQLYKAEKIDEEIFLYYYVQPYYYFWEEDMLYLYDRFESFKYDYNKDLPLGYKETLKNKNLILDMMSASEVDNYKFTFKKQSDGNYYFYSGEWQ